MASIDTKMVEDPNRLAASLTNSGRLIAAVFNATLSAPAPKAALISSKVRNPPPTVKGMKISLDVLATMSSRLFRS